jgi:uncharacterized membrane protein YphA (DoxX/SURF4 family)
MSIMSRPLFVAGRLVVRGLPAILLLWAGLAKAFDRQGSILAVDAYDVLPDGLVRVAAAVLPWFEIGVAALLILGLFVRFAGIATAVLASVFILALAQAKARGLAIDCGCFGGGGAGDGVSWWDILRDVPVLLCGLYLAARPHGPLQLDNRLGDAEADDGAGQGTDAQAGEARAAAGGG